MKTHFPSNAHQTASTSPETLSHTPATADINWFNATLLPAVTKTPDTARSDSLITNPLSQRSALLQDLSNTAARALQKVSASTAPSDIIKSTRAISAFHLETVLSAKMISKTSQAIEKLTNLS